jgi:hypothetical protein
MKEKILTLVGGIPRLVAKRPNLISNEKKERLEKITEKYAKIKEVKYKPFDKEVTVKRRLKTGKSLNLPRYTRYKSEELEVYLNGHLLDFIYDYNHIGDVPRNKVMFTFDLEKNDTIKFVVK